MKLKEIRALDKKDIPSKIFEVQKELIKINGQVATGTTIKNSGQLRNMKKTIARLHTIMNEKSSQKTKGGKTN